MNLYERIEKLCHDRGINITDMCKATGASRGSLGDLKSGKKKVLSAETLLKISNYFGLTVNELISNGDCRLQAARRIKNISRKEIADELGIDLKIYNHYEDTCCAPDHVLKAVSNLLNIDLEFINGTEYVLDCPVSSWSRENKDDHEDATDIEKIVMEYKLGQIRYLSKNSDNSVQNQSLASPLSQEFHDLLGQMTLQDLVELKTLMEEKIKNRR